MDGFLILIVILVALWALVILPRRRNQRAHSAMQDSVSAGDEVITAGGLHGHVRELEERTVRLEIAPEVIVTLDRRAIAAVAREIDVEVEDGSEPEEEPVAGPGAEQEPS
jgi:preprotein translocase subunit YajC